MLAQVDAALGQKELALQEEQHAIDLMPISKDIYDGGLVLEGLAQVYTWNGNNDRAIEVLQKLVSMPSYINYARLKFHPLWKPLRGDPHFEAMVASLWAQGLAPNYASAHSKGVAQQAESAKFVRLQRSALDIRRLLHQSLPIHFRAQSSLGFRENR